MDVERRLVSEAPRRGKRRRAAEWRTVFGRVRAAALRSALSQAGGSSSRDIIQGVWKRLLGKQCNQDGTTKMTLRRIFPLTEGPLYRCIPFLPFLQNGPIQSRLFAYAMWITILFVFANCASGKTHLVRSTTRQPGVDGEKTTSLPRFEDLSSLTDAERLVTRETLHALAYTVKRKDRITVEVSPSRIIIRTANEDMEIVQRMVSPYSFRHGVNLARFFYRIVDP